MKLFTNETISLIDQLGEELELAFYENQRQELKSFRL
jgi:hypothetical protein